MLETLFNRDFPFSVLTDTTRERSSHFWETKDAWCFEVDLPGVPKEHIEVRASGRYLHVTGTRKRREETYQYTERFLLPETIRSAEGITATTEHGVLLVTIPKKANTSVLQIPVN
jgi:HSP20 family molecular chaperone IbpA